MAAETWATTSKLQAERNQKGYKWVSPSWVSSLQSVFSEALSNYLSLFFIDHTHLQRTLGNVFFKLATLPSTIQSEGELKKKKKEEEKQAAKWILTRQPASSAK